MTVFWPDYIESSCRRNHTYFDSSNFLLTAYHTLALISIPLSIFTIFTIIRVTPEKMKNMKVPLTIAQVWSTNLDVFFTVTAAPMTFSPSAAGSFMGILTMLEVPPIWLAYMGQVSIMMMAVSFVMLLENRHSQISGITLKISKLRTRIIYFAINYLISFVICLPYYLENADQLEMRKSVLQRIPCPTIDFYEKNAIVLLKGGELMPFLATVGGLGIILVQTVFFTSHTVYKLNYGKCANVTESTRALQRRFLRYVVLQVTIPWTVLAGPIVYSLYAGNKNYYSQALNNLCMLSMAFHGPLSTCCTLFVITPYRQFVQNIFRGNREYDPNNMWTTAATKPEIYGMRTSIAS